VRLLALVFVGVVLSAYSYQTLMPGYLAHALDRPASDLGFLFGATAVGGIVTTLVLAARRLRNAARALLCFGGLLAAALALLALAPGFWAALAVAALIGVSTSGFQMLNNVNLMERAEPAYLGRVMAVTMMAMGLNSIVAYPVGMIADHIGERAMLAGLSGACALVVAAGVVALRAAPTRAPLSAPAREPGL
jgi:predicted MFS family arabinose efflux permease